MNTLTPQGYETIEDEKDALIGRLNVLDREMARLQWEADKWQRRLDAILEAEEVAQ
jgi:hypothetical protein